MAESIEPIATCDFSDDGNDTRDSARVNGEFNVFFKFFETIFLNYSSFADNAKTSARSRATSGTLINDRTQLFL